MVAYCQVVLEVQQQVQGGHRTASEEVLAHPVGLALNLRRQVAMIDRSKEEAKQVVRENVRQAIRQMATQAVREVVRQSGAEEVREAVSFSLLVCPKQMSGSAQTGRVGRRLACLPQTFEQKRAGRQAVCLAAQST